MIDERVEQCRDTVPAPLVFAAAKVLCDSPNGVCEDCLETVQDILAYPYSYNRNPTDNDPCVACALVRVNSRDIGASCLFHAGVDQGLFYGVDAPVPQRKGRRQRTTEALNRFIMWRWSAIVTAAGFAILYFSLVALVSYL